MYMPKWYSLEDKKPDDGDRVFLAVRETDKQSGKKYIYVYDRVQYFPGEGFWTEIEDEGAIWIRENENIVGWAEAPYFGTVNGERAHWS